MQQRNFDSLKPYITKQILVLSSKYLDEFENNVDNAVRMANEIVLTQLLDNLNNREKINLVNDNVTKISPNAENILQNLANTLGDNNALNVLSTNFLQLFFEQKKDTYSELIAKNSFVKQKSANAIIKMSSIFILCYLAVNKLNVADLASHFDKKKSVNTVPDKKIVNIQADQKAAVNQPVIAEKTTNEQPIKNVVEKQNADKTTKSSKTKIIIVLGILVVGAIAFFLINNNSTETAPTDSVAAVAQDTETQAQVIEGEDITQLGDFIDFTLPSDEIITIPEKGVEKALLDLILDKTKSLDESSFWLCLDRIHFDARDTSYKVESDEQIKNLALILASFPKLEINIGCYTDNLGNPESNKDLSKKRAESLKTGLIKFGISESRITTEGLGDGFPIAENSTPENQKLNRRISIKISQK